MKHPLDDPSYEPKYPRVNGIPKEVSFFGPRTQIRWFKRYLKPFETEDLSSYYVTSEHHKGLCCGSCLGEFENEYQGGGVIADGWCCCRDSRIPMLPG